MSLHPSLKVDSASSQQRSVLTRIERLKDLMKKELWSAGSPVTGLPKIKVVKIKAKKTKAKEAEASAAGAAAPDGQKAEAAPPA